MRPHGRVSGWAIISVALIFDIAGGVLLEYKCTVADVCDGIDVVSRKSSWNEL